MMVARFSPIRDSVVVRVDGFSISVVPERARVREGAKFIVHVDDDGGRMYRFRIREMKFLSPWNTSPEFPYIFEKPGTYTISAEIGRKSKAGVLSVAETPQREYTVLPQIPKTVDLHADRNGVTVGTSLEFTAVMSPPLDGVRYQFSFDDGAPLTWQSSNRATHQFRSAGQYKVRVVAIYQYTKLVSKPVSIEVQPPAPTQVFLKPDRDDVAVKTPVVFTASVDHPSDQVRYRFNFGDGDSSQWQASGSARHTYNTPRKYMATVNVDYPKDMISSKPVAIVVNPGGPLPSGMVTLRASRTDILVDTLVTFTATGDHRSNKLKYRFIFGDGETSPWQKADSATHRYKATGQFMASVEDSVAEDILRSEIVPIRVDRLPQPPWVWIVAGLVLSAAIGTGVRPVRAWIFGPRVTILVKSDKRPPVVRSLTPPTIDVRVILRSKLPAAHFVVTPKDNVLIKSIGRKHA
jgi:PKD repeat protein